MLLLNLADRVHQIASDAADAHQSHTCPPLVAERALAEEGGAGEATAEEGGAEEATADGSTEDLLAFLTLYVSPSAHFFACEPWEATLLARDVSQVDLDGVGRVYRRLDADWFAWLAHRLAHARRMEHDGKLQPEQAASLKEVHARLRTVRHWALQRFGRKALAEAINRGIRPGYQAPVCHLTLWGKNGALGGPQATKEPREPRAPLSEKVPHSDSKPPWWRPWHGGPKNIPGTDRPTSQIKGSQQNKKL